MNTTVSVADTVVSVAKTVAFVAKTNVSVTDSIVFVTETGLFGQILPYSISPLSSANYKDVMLAAFRYSLPKAWQSPKLSC